MTTSSKVCNAPGSCYQPSCGELSTLGNWALNSQEPLVYLSSTHVEQGLEAATLLCLSATQYSS